VVGEHSLKVVGISSSTTRSRLVVNTDEVKSDCAVGESRLPAAQHPARLLLQIMRTESHLSKYGTSYNL